MLKNIGIGCLGLLFGLIAVGLLITSIVWLFQGKVLLAILPIAIIAIAFYGMIHADKRDQKKQKEEKLKRLTDKYSSEEIAKKIVNQEIWQGQSKEQLVESLGDPEAVDEKVLKTKKKEIFKYQRQGQNRFGVKITLENDQVVGWHVNS